MYMHKNCTQDSVEVSSKSLCSTGRWRRRFGITNPSYWSLVHICRGMLWDRPGWKGLIPQPEIAHRFLFNSKQPEKQPVLLIRKFMLSEVV